MPLELNRSDVLRFAKESDYGFRDYSPAHARFITEDPIRDGENWFAYVGNNPVNWIDPWGLSASDGQKDNNTAVSTGFHIPGLLPTIPQVNVTNSKVINYGIAIGASALNLVSSAGNFLLSGVDYANTLVDKTIDIADKYVPSWLTLNGSVRRDIPAIEFATAVLAPEIALYNQANKIYSQLKSANFLNTLFQNATTPLKRGVTPVGRALQKHSARATSIFYGMSNSGNAAANSAIGKDYLANILANGTKTTDIHPVFNEVIKFRLSDGTGAWWKTDGSFIGLLEPYTK